MGSNPTGGHEELRIDRLRNPLSPQLSAVQRGLVAERSSSLIGESSMSNALDHTIAVCDSPTFERTN